MFTNFKFCSPLHLLCPEIAPPHLLNGRYTTG